MTTNWLMYHFLTGLNADQGLPKLLNRGCWKDYMQGYFQILAKLPLHLKSMKTSSSVEFC